MRSLSHWPWPSQKAWRTCMLVSIPCCTPSSGWISETTSGRSYGTSGAWGRTTCQWDGPHGPPLKCIFPRVALWMAHTMKMALRLPCDLVLIKGEVPSIVTGWLALIKNEKSHFNHVIPLHVVPDLYEFLCPHTHKSLTGKESRTVWLGQPEVE